MSEIRLKYLFSKRIGGAWGNDPKEDNSFICIRAADFNTELLTHSTENLTRRSFDENEVESKRLITGDLIIEKSGGGENQPVGRVVKFNLDQPALCSNFLELLRPDKSIANTEYLAYLFYTLWNNRVVTKAIKQTTGIQNLDISDYLDNKIQLPGLANQNRIVSYLNKHVAHIDNLIEQKQKQIEILEEKRQSLITQAVTRGINPNVKLKDSGIEWLGKIPQQWENIRLKFITNKIGSGVTPKGGATVYQDEGIPLLRSQNVHFDGLRLEDVAYISPEIHSSMKNTAVLDGDVLLNITGASIGRCFYYDGSIGEANVNQHVCIIRPNSNINTQYLYFLLSSDIGQLQIDLNQEGGGREGLSFESIKDFIFPIPEYNEQLEIISKIKKGLDLIDKLIKLTNSSVELLQEKRATLITAAVTGKINI